jgi:signal transduction histidine kinase
MQWVKEHKSWVGFFIALLLFFVTFLFTLYINNNLDSYIHKLEQSNHDINSLDRLFTLLKRNEIRLRSGLINDTPLPADSALTTDKEITATLDSLSRSPLAEDRQAAQTMLRNFDSAAFYAQQMFTLVSRTPDGAMTPVFRQASYRRIATFNALYISLSDLRDIKKKGLFAGYENLQQTSHNIKIIIIVLILVSMILAFYAFINYHREYSAKKTSDRKTAESQQELEMRVKELDTAYKELSSLRSIEKFAATGRVARTIAHEVRNPLTNINLAADQLIQQLKESGQYEEASVLLNMIFRNSNRINAMISDLLNSTKATELKYSVVNINTLLDEVIETAKDRINLREVTIQKDYRSSGEVEVDVEKMKIAFLNIIINGLESMEEKGGTLLISTSTEGSRCRISVTDHGVGMDQEAVHHVFEAYYTTKQKGSGLGLTNTQNIILSHKGEINITSQPGIGTTFNILLSEKR